jgi:hypothetical protein
MRTHNNLLPETLGCDRLAGNRRGKRAQIKAPIPGQLERYAAYIAGRPAWRQPRLANSRKKMA